jgi:CRISPR-associated protein Csm3
MEHQLEKKILIQGNISLLTGLHIGGANVAMGIGGIDKAVIRNPLDNRPLIPGSSLKGKMRSLLELHNGTLGPGNGPTKDDKLTIVQLFGNAIGRKEKDEGIQQIPSRLIVRDALISNQQEDFPFADLPFSEAKTEVNIDRITSQANPRQIERVPAGARFPFTMVLNIFKGDNQQVLLNELFCAMLLLEDDYLGGHGSRGYGQVTISIEKILERNTDYYKSNASEKEITKDCEIPIGLKSKLDSSL